MGLFSTTSLSFATRKHAVQACHSCHSCLCGHAFLYHDQPPLTPTVTVKLQNIIQREEASSLLPSFPLLLIPLPAMRILSPIFGSHR